MGCATSSEEKRAQEVFNLNFMWPDLDGKRDVERPTLKNISKLPNLANLQCTLAIRFVTIISLSIFENN